MFKHITRICGCPKSKSWTFRSIGKKYFNVNLPTRTPLRILKMSMFNFNHLIVSIGFGNGTRGLSNTPKLSPINEGHQQPDSPEVSSREGFCGWGGKCWQTDSIGSVGDGLPLQESIGLTASQFARDLVNIHQSGVSLGVENVGKRTPSDPMETG